MTRRFFLIQHKHEHMVWLWTRCLTLPLLSCSKNIFHFIFIFLSTCMGHILIRSRKKGDRLKFKLWQFYDVDILCKKKESVFYSYRASLIFRWLWLSWRGTTLGAKDAGYSTIFSIRVLEFRPLWVVYPNPHGTGVYGASVPFDVVPLITICYKQ